MLKYVLVSAVTLAVAAIVLAIVAQAAECAQWSCVSTGGYTSCICLAYR